MEKTIKTAVTFFPMGGFWICYSMQPGQLLVMMPLEELFYPPNGDFLSNYTRLYTGLPKAQI